jgi:hypothetical protein
MELSGGILALVAITYRLRAFFKSRWAALAAA